MPYMTIEYNKKQALKATSLPSIYKIQAISILWDIIETYICKGATKKEIKKYIRRMNRRGNIDRYTFIFIYFNYK